MKLRNFSLLAVMMLSATALAQSSYDLQKPFGFCTVTSRTSSTDTYTVTGGGCYTYPITGVDESNVLTLTSTGQDMRSEIKNAIEDKNKSIIVFDGSKGDFIVSSTISFEGIKNKTLIGINNARICTTWYATKEILDALNDAGVPDMSTSSGGGTLPNGVQVKEEAEYNTRKIIIEMTGDMKEAYRSSGLLFLKSCENLIIRNLKFQGPGSIDVSGSDLVSFYGTKNSWVDHCEFMDGMDGNFDITQASDFNTVSWCTFSYSSRSYMHQNTNLLGSSDKEAQTHPNTHNTTFAFNHWGKGCKARMPMGRVGKIHMLNNYYTCTSGGNCINPRIDSEFLIEGNYFDKGVKSIYAEKDATAVTWKNTNYSVEGKKGSSKGSTVTVPYNYTPADNSVVPTEVGAYAGAKLFNNDEGGGGTDPTPAPGDDEEIPSLVEGNSYVVGSGEDISNGKTVECDNITMTYGNDGKWSVSERSEMTSEGFSNLAGGENNPKDAQGKNYSSSKKVPTTGTYYVFTPTTDGTLYVASYIYTNKNVYVTEDGVAIPFSINGTDYDSGDIINKVAETDGYIKFDVTNGKEYYVFGESTKIKIYGFNFEPSDNTTGTKAIRQPLTNDSAPTYNMAGQRVVNNYNGILIIDKKVVLR